MFDCDSVTRILRTFITTPVSRRNTEVQRSCGCQVTTQTSPHGKGIECSESFLVQKSSAMFNQCRRKSIIDLARNVLMVAEDRLRVLTSQSFIVRSPLAFCDSSVFICVIRGQHRVSSQPSGVRRSNAAPPRSNSATQDCDSSTQPSIHANACNHPAAASDVAKCKRTTAARCALHCYALFVGLRVNSRP